MYNYKIIFYYKNNICIYVRCQKYWRTLCVCVGAIINNINQLCFCDCSSCVRLKVSSGNRQVFKVLGETVCWDGGGLEQVSVSICTNINIYKYYLKSFCIYLSFFLVCGSFRNCELICKWTFLKLALSMLYKWLYVPTGCFPHAAHFDKNKVMDWQQLSATLRISHLLQTRPALSKR